MPTAKLDLVIFAWCVAGATPAVPMTVAPSLKVTVPLGLPATAGVTVAVNVTAVPCVAGLPEDLRVVVVFTLFTCSLTNLEVLAAKFGEPLYRAVMECMPAFSCAVEKVALPPDTGTVASVVAPSMNATLPGMVPATFELTDAVKVTV